MAQAGAPGAALEELENQNGLDKDTLYYLERGELLRMQGKYAESRDAWLQADAEIRKWEEVAKTDPSKLLGEIGAYLVNDTMRRYDGRDYEKVLVSVRLVFDYLALGDWEAARVEIKKMHEREALIAEFNAILLEKAREESEKRGLEATSFRELNGYPVETLDDPEVNALKNAYESAIANYLAGFVYEALGEPSLAAAGYRKAIEMRPNVAVLEEALRGLDKRTGNARQANGVDTLFIVESGYVPAIVSQRLVLPVPVSGKLVLTPISWPVIYPVDSSVIPDSLSINGMEVPLDLVTNVDLMARRSLADEMPGIIVRSSVRAIAKSAAQSATQSATRDSSSELASLLINLAVIVATVASEQADERAWRTLPAFYSITRAVLSEGAHTVTLDMPRGPVEQEINVSGKYAVVVIRASGDHVYISQMPTTDHKQSVVTN